MTTTLLRCLLAPRTSWHALRLMRATRRSQATAVSFDVAWRRVRVRLRPDEAAHRLAGHRAPDAGTHTDRAQNRTRHNRS